jgi:hypothetical protein
MPTPDFDGLNLNTAPQVPTHIKSSVLIENLACVCRRKLASSAQFQLSFRFVVQALGVLAEALLLHVNFIPLLLTSFLMLVVGASNTFIARQSAQTPNFAWRTKRSNSLLP